MKPMRIVAATVLWTLVSGGAWAQFDGSLELIPPGCEQIGQCKLKGPLRFTDAAKVVWEARAELMTDGASIPGLFQPFIGSPFDPAFIKAAVIHDHYCDRHVRPWGQTHRVFYEGLIAGGVSLAKAKTMYFAVFLGGPKWVELLPGIKCGTTCVKDFKSTSGVAGMYSRRANHSAVDVALAVQSAAKLLDLNPESLSLDDLEKIARELRPADFFYENGDTVKASVLGIIE